MREAGCIIPLALVHLRKKLGAFLIFVVHFGRTLGALTEIVVHFRKTVVHNWLAWCNRLSLCQKWHDCHKQVPLPSKIDTNTL